MYAICLGALECQIKCRNKLNILLSDLLWEKWHTIFPRLQLGKGLGSVQNWSKRKKIEGLFGNKLFS